MPTWLSFFVAALAAVAVFAIVMLVALRWLAVRLMNLGMDVVMRRFLQSRYTENLFGMFGVIRKMGVEFFMETMLRASQGKALSRPMGTPLHFSPWQKLLLQPVYVTPRLPTPQEAPIDTAVTIGPKAQKPLRLELPVLIAGMSFGGALTVPAKVALARGANSAGTATNSGESYLQEERDAANKLILQHHRGLWPNSTMSRPELLHNADAIEIQFGQGAQAAAAMVTPSRLVGPHMRQVYGLEEGERSEIATRFKGVNGPEDVIEMIRDLKRRFPVPIGVKIGANDYLESDLDVFLEGGIDFITVDGAEGGTHGGPTALQDDVGLPTMHAIARADRHLRARNRRQDVTVIASGQLRTPGTFLKAMAIGADAVYIGTAAMIALITDQAQKALPGEPPYQLFLQSAPGRLKGKLNVERAAHNVANYLQSSKDEMVFVAQSLGHRALADIGRDDLVALDRDTAEICGVRLAWRTGGAGEIALTFRHEEPQQGGVESKLVH